MAYANTLGIQVVVTDHHHRQEEKVPRGAFSQFHTPKLSGSGVAYMVAHELFEHFKQKTPNAKLLDSYFSTDYLALATIGTIADLVPLTGASRSIVTFGLEAFGKVRRHGIKHLLKEAGIDKKPVTPYEIGFVIAPRINAVGRLEDAIDALRLLCTTNEDKARGLAQYVGETNTSRQDLVKKNVEEALQQVEAMKKLPKLIILKSKHWHEGVIGL
ncbi:single-stranded-DNA-specific exonuclease RecJ, partial [Candidatus Beckwithbacteria bacterium CG10_big_fil_rev_8_21_14_0_10_34_10]